MFKFRFRINNLVVVFMVVIGIPQEALFTSNIKPTSFNILNYDGKTYYFGNIFKVNFYSALQFCRQQGMQLVSIASKRESDRLYEFAKEIGLQDEYFWTSATNRVDSKKFVWLSTGNPFIYTNWGQGQPSGRSHDDSEDENCVEIGGAFLWNDRSCGAQLSFICEKYQNCEC